MTSVLAIVAATGFIKNQGTNVVISLLSEAFGVFASTWPALAQAYKYDYQEMSFRVAEKQYKSLAR